MSSVMEVIRQWHPSTAPTCHFSHKSYSQPPARARGKDPAEFMVPAGRCCRTYPSRRVGVPPSRRRRGIESESAAEPAEEGRRRMNGAWYARFTKQFWGGLLAGVGLGLLL